MRADLEFAYDLTLDEARRRSAVLEAIGEDWDPVAVLAEEERAYEMLYSDLDDEQQRIYDELVLRRRPARSGGRPCCRLIRPPTVHGVRGCPARAATTPPNAMTAPSEKTAPRTGSTC